MIIIIDVTPISIKAINISACGAPTKFIAAVMGMTPAGISAKLSALMLITLPLNECTACWTIMALFNVIR